MKLPKTITHKEYLNLQMQLMAGVAARVVASNIDVEYVRDATDKLLMLNNTVIADDEKKDQPSITVNFSK